MRSTIRGQKNPSPVGKKRGREKKRVEKGVCFRRNTIISPFEGYTQEVLVRFWA